MLHPPAPPHHKVGLQQHHHYEVHEGGHPSAVHDYVHYVSPARQLQPGGQANSKLALMGGAGVFTAPQ